MDRKLVYIDQPPEDIGLYSYCMARGERIGERYPDPANIFLRTEYPGIKLASLLGNTLNYLIVNSAMKQIIAEASNSELELLSFNLYNHKKRIHSTDYWIINPIGTIDCLNLTASEIKYMPDGVRVIAVKKIVLDPGKLSMEPTLFRIKENPGKYVINTTLAKSFQEREFTNIFLEELNLQQDN